jgi:hypothetical protein
MNGSFEKTKNAILKLIENDIPLQISCPIMKNNKNCYKDVVKWAEKYNIRVGSDHVIIARYDHAIKNLNCRLSIGEVMAVISDKSVDDNNYYDSMELEFSKKKNMTPKDAA